MDITRWSILKSDYIFYSWRWRSSIQSAKTRPQADCSSDHKFLIDKFRLKLKTVGKTTNTIQVWPKSNPLWLYNGSDKQIRGIRSDRQSVWRTMDRDLNHCTGDCDQNHLQEKEIQKGKTVLWGGLTNSREKERSKRQRINGKIYPSECKVPKNSKERWDKALLNDPCKEIEENNRMGRSRYLVKKIRDTKGTFHAKMSTLKEMVWA